MKLGFSGTQEGMTEEQVIVTSGIVAAWAVEGITEFHHGCCIGSDRSDRNRDDDLSAEQMGIVHG